MKVRLLPGAVKDLEEIHDYMGMQDQKAADQVVGRIVKSLQLLSMRPEIGRATKGKPIREWSIPGLPYVVPYAIVNNDVAILRIYHTRRRRPAHW